MKIFLTKIGFHIHEPLVSTFYARAIDKINCDLADRIMEIFSRIDSIFKILIVRSCHKFKGTWIKINMDLSLFKWSVYAYPPQIAINDICIFDSNIIFPRNGSNETIASRVTNIWAQEVTPFSNAYDIKEGINKFIEMLSYHYDVYRHTSSHHELGSTLDYKIIDAIIYKSKICMTSEFDDNTVDDNYVYYQLQPNNGTTLARLKKLNPNLTNLIVFKLTIKPLKFIISSNTYIKNSILKSKWSF